MSLNEIIKEDQTKCLNDNGVFFAFSDKQFYEQRTEGVKYVSLGAGMICPVENVKKFTEEHKKIVSEGIKKDIETNGIEKIILGELTNYECFYVCDYTEALEALEDYGVTEEQVRKVYNENRAIYG